MDIVNTVTNALNNFAQTMNNLLNQPGVNTYPNADGYHAVYSDPANLMNPVTWNTSNPAAHGNYVLEARSDRNGGYVVTLNDNTSDGVDWVWAAPSLRSTVGLTYTGDAGNGALFGSIGRDTIDGGGGKDLLVGSKGGDILRGGWGADRILGGEDSDILIGGPGADRMFGGHGNDRLDLGTGDIGGGGRHADTFVFQKGATGIRVLSADPVYDKFDFVDSRVWVTDTDATYFKATNGTATWWEVHAGYYDLHGNEGTQVRIQLDEDMYRIAYSRAEAEMLAADPEARGFLDLI